MSCRRALGLVVVSLAALAFPVVGSCDPSGPAAESTDTMLRPALRFVDDDLRLVEPLVPPVAMIGNETRSVLRPFPSSVVFYSASLEVAEDGRFALERDLPAVLRSAPRLILQPIVQQPESRWTVLPSVSTPVRFSAGAPPSFAAILDLASVPSREVALRVNAFVPPDRSLDTFDTPVVEIPGGALMEFGLGILDAAWDQGPVRFSLQSCWGGECESMFSEVLDPERPESRGWQDRAVSLAQLAGRRVSFRFAAERLEPGDDGFSFPVWSNPAVFVREPRPGDAVSFIILSLDTLRADHLTSYGYARDTAPFIEARFAKRGVVFDKVTSSATNTAPSHMTMFTGLQPSVHSAWENTGYKPVPASARTLAEELRSHGFETGAVTENAAIVRARGFGRGFDTYWENKSPDVTRGQGNIERTFAEGLAWLRRQKDKRFFLFLHTYQVHDPFTPPETYDELFAEPIEGSLVPDTIAPHRHPDLYDREIRYTDDQLRALVETLEAEGILDHAVFILTSDHGEEFLEHGFVGHGADIHEEILRVPLVFTGPGVPVGRRVDVPVGLVDLMPTVLELAGLPPVAGMGRSLAGLIRGDAAEGGWHSRPLFAEAWSPRGYRATGLTKVEQPTFSVRVGDRKLIRYRAGDGHRYAYYDLATDPAERRDLYALRAHEAADLRELIDGYEGLTGELRAELERAERGGRRGPAPPIDPERESKLRALGYID